MKEADGPPSRLTGEPMGELARDIRFGLRTLLRSPGFCAVAVLTIALGVGVNTAMFSIVNATLLAPLPYPDADRLVFVRDIQPQLDDLPGSYHEYLDWKEQAQIFEQAGSFWNRSATLTGSGDPERLGAARITPEIFPLLGLRPQLGRAFEEADDSPSAEPVAILGHGLWQRRFGGQPAVLGTRVQVDGVDTTIVGVLPPGAESLLPNDLRRGGEREIWLPLRLDREGTSRGSHFLTVVARLRPDVTRAQADDEIGRVAQAFKDDGRTRHGIMLVGFDERIVGPSRASVLVLMGAVGFVLLIACVNVANLLMARAASRYKEVAIRSSLGASRSRLVRQFLTESFLLAAAGGAVGLAIAWWAVRLFSASAGANVLRSGAVSIELPVVLFCLGAVVLTGLLSGIVPALHASSTNLNETLKEEGRRSGGGEGRQLFRSGLVVVEVALSLILLVGAGLLLRSFQNLLDVDLGFDERNLLTYRVALPDTRYDEPEKVARFWDDAIERINTIPGVRGSGAVTTLPVEGGWNGPFNVEGIDWGDGFSPLAEQRRVNPDYFRVMGIRLLKGRGLTPDDTADAPPVALVNQELVRQVFGDDEPLGRRIYFGDDADATRLEIVGVVSDVQHWSLGKGRRPAIYFPQPQRPQSSMVMLVRTTGDPLATVGAVRGRIQSIDPDLPISDVRPMSEVVADDLATRRLSMTLLLAFAVLALFLASIGLYGVMNYTVAQRTHEMGIRMALGAASASIVALVMRYGLVMVGLGLALGLAGAFALTRFLASLVYDVGTLDVGTFLVVPLILALVALLACLLPARKASRVDPMVALRRG
jgi:putative ABC transport system permease protein